MASVTYGEVGVSLGRSITSSSERAQIYQWVGDAELQIGARLGNIALLNQPMLAYVVREAVAARLRNPEGYQSETVDDYTYRLPSETRRITILPEWWALLSPDGRAASVFSARPQFTPDTETPLWGAAL